MTDRLEQLKRQLNDWLRRNGLDGDLDFWTQAKLQQRGEDYLNGARFVITTEGGLHSLLNYAFDHPKIDELQDLLSSFPSNLGQIAERASLASLFLMHAHRHRFVLDQPHGGRFFDRIQYDRGPEAASGLDRAEVLVQQASKILCAP